MAHRYKFIDAQGEEQVLADTQELIAAIADKAIIESTLIFDAGTEKWRVASETEAYKLAQRLSQLDFQSVVDPAMVTNKLASAPIATQYISEPVLSQPPALSERTTFPRWQVSKLIAVSLFMAAMILSFRAEQRGGSTLEGAAGFAVGQFIFFVVLALIIGRFAPRSNRWIGRAVGGALFLAVAFGAYTKNERLLSDTRATASSLIQASTSTAPVAVPNDTLTLAFVFALLANQANSSWDDYNQVVQALDEDWIAPPAMASASGRRNARLMTASLREATRTLAEGLRQAFETASTRLESLSASHQEYRATRAGFEKTSPAAQSLLRTFVQVELDFLDAVDSLILIADENKPSVAADGQTLLFASDNAIASYNRWTQEVGRLAQSEQIALDALRKHNLASIRRMDSLRTAIE
jgi:hypothetical protein